MERDRDEWRRPWRTAASDTASPAARVTFVNGDATSDPDTDAGRVDTVPIGARTVEDGIRPASPQPPPEMWGPGDTGPGSPAGSVRPPDTTGTVDAPAPGRGSGRRGVGMALLGALVGAVIGTAGTLAVVESRGTSGASGPASTGGPDVQAPTVEVPGDGGPSVVSAVARAVTPSVVRIDVEAGGGGIVTGGSSGVGSGVIYRSDGYIITNNHVVEGATSVQVRFSDGAVAEADVVGTDPLNDLAVVKVERTGLPAINIRTEPQIQVGETAIAIGSPFGLDTSVTAGVVSGVDRQLQVPQGDSVLVIPAVVQTDAAINPGNSGGALVDSEGRLMGINTAILSGSGGSQGVGFAIPVASAVSTADQLIEQGFVRHAFLGILGRDVTPQMADRLGLEPARGAVVEEVVEGSAAAEAGIEPEDVIVAVEERPIADMVGLMVAMRDYAPGDTVTLTVLRDGRERGIDVTLGERPE